MRTDRKAGFSYAVDSMWVVLHGKGPFNRDVENDIYRAPIEFTDDNGELREEMGMRIVDHRTSRSPTYQQEKMGWTSETVARIDFPEGATPSVMRALKQVAKKHRLEVERLPAFREPATRGKTAGLREDLVRLAHEVPGLRAHLVPILRNGAVVTKHAFEDQHWDDDDPRAPWTPWGPAQVAYNINVGVKWFSTASHGGLMVSAGAARRHLTPAAIKQGHYEKGAYWYEEDIGFAVPFYEKPEWVRIADQKMGAHSGTKEQLGDTIRKYFPEYFEDISAGGTHVAPPKKGDIVRFTKPIATEGGTTLEAGDRGVVDFVSGSNIVVFPDKYENIGVRFGMQRWLDGSIVRVASRGKRAMHMGEPEIFFGRGIRIKFWDHPGNQMIIEELPGKPFKTRLRRATFDTGMLVQWIHGSAGSNFLMSNLLQDAGFPARAKGAGYDEAVSDMREVIEKAKQGALSEDPSAADILNGGGWRTVFSEESVSWLEVEPVDYGPMGIDGKDFHMSVKWGEFSAYSPSSFPENDPNTYGGDPHYTVIKSSSKGAARKLFKAMKANPDALKNVSWHDLSDWLRKAGIGSDMHFSQWH